MASNTHCTACLRLLRQQLQQTRTTLYHPHRSARLFSRTASISAAQSSPAVAPPTTTRAPADPPSKNIKTFAEKSPNASPAHKIATEVRKRAASVTETYIAYGVSDKLVKECARQADYTIPQVRVKGVDIPKTPDGEDLGVGTGWWYDTLGLTPTFNTWAQITFLHMYLLTVRIRCFPSAHAPSWHQHLLDHFFYAAEDRMVTVHNVHARAVRNKYLKDLFIQWRGLMAGYDEGLLRGDAVLATAVWRNVFKGQEEVDLRGVGEVVSYMRGVLRGLDGMADEGIAGGEVVFGDPGSEREGVLVRSKMMDIPFEEEEGGKAGEVVMGT